MPSCERRRFSGVPSPCRSPPRSPAWNRSLRWSSSTRPAGPVSCSGTAPHEHRFVHDLVAEAVVATIGSAERVRLHAAIRRRHGAPPPRRPVATGVRHRPPPRRGPCWGPDAEAAAWLGVVPVRRRWASWGTRRRPDSPGPGRRRPGARSPLPLGAPGGCRSCLPQAAGENVARNDACLAAVDLARSAGWPERAAEAVLVMEVLDLTEPDRLTRRLAEEALAALGPAPTPLRARRRVTSRRSSSSWAFPASPPSPPRPRTSPSGQATPPQSSLRCGLGGWCKPVPTASKTAGRRRRGSAMSW